MTDTGLALLSDRHRHTERTKTRNLNTEGAPGHPRHVREVARVRDGGDRARASGRIVRDQGVLANTKEVVPVRGF